MQLAWLALNHGERAFMAFENHESGSPDAQIFSLVISRKDFLHGKAVCLRQPSFLVKIALQEITTGEELSDLMINDKINDIIIIIYYIK